MNVFSGAEMYDVRCEAVTRWQSRPLRPAARTGYTELGTWAQWPGRPGQSWDMECYGHTVGSEWGQERGAVCHTRAKDRLWCVLAEKIADWGQHGDIRDQWWESGCHRVRGSLSADIWDVTLESEPLSGVCSVTLPGLVTSGQVWGEGDMDTLMFDTLCSCPRMYEEILWIPVIRLRWCKKPSEKSDWK